MMIVEYIARRAVDANELETLVAWIDKQPDSRLNLLKGMRDGLEGQLDLAPPDNWADVYASEIRVAYRLQPGKTPAR